MSVKSDVDLRSAKVRRRAVIREWVESLIVAFLLAMVIRAFVVQAFKIPTGSMRMTLIEEDIILVNKFIYGAKVPFTDLRLPKVRDPQRGDVIVFIYPEDRKKDFIKRLVGLPGETIEIRNGSIYVNGVACDNPLISNRFYYNRGSYGMENQMIVVPKDSFFVLGDNSRSSQDSRYWGFVPRNNILGKAFLIYWPLNRIHLIN